MRNPQLNFPGLVIFDLDGTLVDSVPDISVALNAARRDLRLPPVAVDDVRGWVGNGAFMLARRALAQSFDAPANPEAAEPLYRRFLARYAERVCEHSTVYPGVMHCLRELRAAGCKLACVTNKPQALAQALLETLQLEACFSLLLGGDSLAEKKPRPAPLLHAMRELEIDPDRTLMVGDSSSDTRAAAAAGVRCVVVSYGYHQGEDVHALGAARVLDSLAELPQILQQEARYA